MDKSANNLERAIHGALDYGELERLDMHPWEVLDFSVNANPYGPSLHVREAVTNAVIDRYPDRECLELRRAILDLDWRSTQRPSLVWLCNPNNPTGTWLDLHQVSLLTSSAP